VTAHTGTASTVPEPFGKPSGPGLWHHKGLQLPPYIQHVAHHLVAQGHDESKAIEMAVGIVRDWAEGRNGRGGKVHPDVQAAAAKNIAQWEADKAKAGKARRSGVTTTQRAAMATASINDLPDSDFAYVESGGKKDSSGRTVPRSLRHFPIHDATHVRDALSRAPDSPFGDRAMPAIRKAAKKFGIDSGDDTAGASRSQRAELFRSYALEDAHIVTRAQGDGSGRLVEAYCAVFGEPAEIHDHQGHYKEEIDRAAFNKRIADVERSKAGFGMVKCHYNHALTIHGTPSERFSMPVAVTRHISAESRGVLTRAYYLDTPLGNEVLEMWREGAITSQSFTGQIIRSSPELRRGDKYRPRGGELTCVRRLELGLKEYGPTPFPAYSGAELVGVRMSPLGTYQAADDDAEYDIDAALAPDEEAAAGEPLARDDGEHSARYHQHALYRLRSQEIRERIGLVL
jgi:phage head maturation protease